MKKVTLAQETKKLNKYEELKGVSIVLQPVDILVTTEKSKELLEKGKVILDNYKGKDILLLYKDNTLKAYTINSAEGLVMENGKLYKLEVVDNSQEVF